MCKVSGIYKIINLINNKVYIGKSVDVKRRIQKHRNALNKNKHYNKHLQSAYNLYGKDNFDFSIVEQCHIDSLVEREQYWINNSNQIYNKIKDVVNHNGNSFLGKHHSEKTKNKLSDQRRGKNIGKDNPNFGNKQSIEVRIAMTINNTHTKLSEKDVKIIVKQLQNGEKHQDIANHFNVSRTVITRISNGTRWTNITGGAIFPTAYKNGIRQFSERHRTLIGQGRKGKKHTKESKQKISQSRIKLFEGKV